MPRASGKPKKSIGNRQGQSLIQVMVAVGVAGILMLAMMTMQSNQNREMQSLKEKLAAADFQQQLIRAFADGSVCKSLLAGPSPMTFDSSSSSVNLNYSAIPVSAVPGAPILASAGQAVSPIATSLVAASSQPFQILNISGTSDGTTGVYTASFQVNFDSSRLIRPMHPAVAQITLQTSSSGTAQTVTSCQLSTSGPTPKLFTATVNDVNNAGGSPCHNACGPPAESVMWVAACPSRYCKDLGYTGGVVQEYDCTGGPTGNAKILCFP